MPNVYQISQKFFEYDINKTTIDNLADFLKLLFPTEYMLQKLDGKGTINIINNVEISFFKNNLYFEPRSKYIIKCLLKVNLSPTAVVYSRYKKLYLKRNIQLTNKYRLSLYRFLQEFLKLKNMYNQEKEKYARYQLLKNKTRRN